MKTPHSATTEGDDSPLTANLFAHGRVGSYSQSVTEELTAFVQEEPQHKSKRTMTHDAPSVGLQCICTHTNKHTYRQLSRLMVTQGLCG